MTVNYEARFHGALRRIVAYMTSDQLRRKAETLYGVSYEEALEMAYDNVRGEAVAALKGYRRKSPAVAASTNAVDPSAQPRESRQRASTSESSS